MDGRQTLEKAAEEKYKGNTVRHTAGNGSILNGLVDEVAYWNGEYISFGDTRVGNEVTLYKFLTNNRDIYDVTFFTNKTPLNYFGL